MLVTTPQDPTREDSDELDEVVIEPSPFAIFTDCPNCGEPMAPEHAHYRCTGCGWRDSCCD